MLSKEADLVRNYIWVMANCNIGWAEVTYGQMLRGKRRFYGNVTATLGHQDNWRGWGSIEQYKYKVAFIFNKAFAVGHNRDPDMEKQLFSIFRRSLHRMQVQTELISQDPATTEEPAWTAIPQNSFLSEVRCECFHAAMEVGHHRQRLNIQAVNRNRDQGRVEGIIKLFKVSLQRNSNMKNQPSDRMFSGFEPCTDHLLEMGT